ncbi:MAG: N-formylglutamate amidohydrolase [Akkermansiaceae bacterium]
MSRSIAVLLLALFPGLFLLVAAGDQTHPPEKESTLISFSKGDLPIILSAPHGGRQKIPGVEPRVGEGIKRFVDRTDIWTDQLTQKLANEIETSTRKRPYVVVANFHRKYVDANRSPELAYESPKAKLTYDAYHAALAEAKADVEKRFGRGLVIDIHGQASLLDTVIRGTQNGKTVEHLVQKFGNGSHLGKTSLFGRLKENGFEVNPSVGSSDREHPKFTGGYITRKYGSMDGGTVDAIQLELGKNLRRPENLEKNTKRLSSAIISFATEYLPSKELKKIKVGVYIDKGAGRSKDNLLTALAKFNDVSVRKLTANGIVAGELNGLDVLIQPGGSGGAQGRHLGPEGREKIRRFLKNGGGFLGICAGAYLASADYSWSLDILDAKVVDRKHWARGKGLVIVTMAEDWTEPLKLKKETSIFYGQGPLLAPANNPDIPDYEAIATFKTEIAEKGAPPGVMPGTTAIARGRFGKGRIICFSPHPELTPGLEHLVQHAIHEVTSK